jgi:hypothetical protein
VPARQGDAVLITGVYGSGKSSIAAEIAYNLERHERRYALLDLDYLGWGWSDEPEFEMTQRNLAAVAENYRDAGVDSFVLAYFVRDLEMLRAIREALRVPLRVVRLSVPLPEMERRLASDVTSGRLDDLREAASSLERGTGIGLEDVAIDNDRPVASIARHVMSWLGWL